MTSRQAEPGLAAVAIGRNEGARLIACLDSLAGRVGRLVYVDSGSTDGSQAAAAARGAEVVTLDLSMPFTAARARNAGLDHLMQNGPPPRLVQFLDGDCALEPGWLETATSFLDAHPDVAVVCGRRREIHPDASLWNRLIDAEWDTPVGEAKACGGDALMRVASLRAVGGYNPALIAGEEPELCVRLRAVGWRIWRLDAPMTRHDAAMTRFGQWWTRSKRAGHAFAEGFALHGAPPERHYATEVLHIAVWGLVLPLGILALALLVSPWTLVLAAIWPLQVLRLYLKGYDRVRALVVLLSRFAEVQGALLYLWRRLRRGRVQLIEYK
jgi:GT2 family glycosyltransferase